MKERIGFIGVGLMGHGMAKNIVEKGFPLTVLAHRKREAVDDLKARGAEGGGEPARASPRRATSSSSASPARRKSKRSSMGTDGLASAGKPLLIVDCSTSEPASTRRLAADLAP